MMQGMFVNRIDLVAVAAVVAVAVAVAAVG